MDHDQPVQSRQPMPGDFGSERLLQTPEFPTGIQIVGKTFDDMSVFRAAAAFEGAKPWHHGGLK